MKKLRIAVLPSLILVSIVMFEPDYLYSVSSNDQDPWVAPASADAVTNPLEIDEYTLEDGEDVYKSNCMVCHGEKGDANTPTAAALNPKPKNYTDPTFLAQSDGAIFWKINQGRGMMVSYKEVLQEDEIWSVIVYIKSLSKGK